MADQGGAKKFLYTGPKKGNDDDDDDMPWNFNTKNQKQNNGNPKFELDGVWSIQRNVNVNGATKQPKSDGLTYNANNKYYSRHSGAAKDNDDFSSYLDGVNAKNSNSGNYASSDSGGKSWSVGNQQSRRPFSYAYGNEHKNTAEHSVSPQHISHSSTGVYPQTESSMFVSQTGSGMNSGNLNSYRGGNSMNQDSASGLNSHGMDRMQNKNSVYNKSIMSTSNGANNSFNPTPRNSLFNSPQMGSGLLGNNSKRPNNKSFW
ncbi:hypothetical protein ACF0H5_007546 [Mactra antiquata]